MYTLWAALWKAAMQTGTRLPVQWLENVADATDWQIMGNSDNNWNYASRLVPACLATEPEGSRSSPFPLLLLSGARLVSWSGGAVNTAISGSFSGVCTEPSSFTVGKWALGRRRSRVAERRHKGLSHWFLTAVCGHHDVKRRSRDTCHYWRLQCWQWWVDE